MLRPNVWQSPLEQIYPVSLLLEHSLTLEEFEAHLRQFLQAGGREAVETNKKICDLAEILDGLIYASTSNIDAVLKRQLVAQSLKDLLGPRGAGNLVLAQMNPKVGHFGASGEKAPGNAQQIIQAIQAAESIGVDLIIFPELALMGYTARDMIVRYPDLVMQQMLWLQEIAAMTENTAALVGFVEPRLSQPGQKRIGRPYFNSLAVLQHGRIQGIVRKTLLPNYGEFEDWRTFEPSPAIGVHSPQTLCDAAWGFSKPAVPGKAIELWGRTYGITLCEDMWNDEDYFENPLYKTDPMKDTAALKPDVLINVSASPSRAHKAQLKHTLLRHLAQKYQLPLVYVNQVGAIDEMVFDGASLIYTATGQLCFRAKSFQAQFAVTNPYAPLGRIYRLTEKIERAYDPQVHFDPFDTADLERVYYALLLGIRDYFGKRGFTKRAVLGLSGGLDSSVTAVLLADALGPHNVLGIRMRNVGITSEESEVDAFQLTQNLGIGLLDMPITQITKAFYQQLADAACQMKDFWSYPSGEDTTEDNLQARSRAVNIWAIANRFHAMAIATCDKSEIYMGYTTIGGDMLGELAPLGGVAKEQVRSLARWMNQHRSQKNAIPQRSIDRPSGAELRRDETGQLITAEQARMPYPFMDEVIYRYEARQQSISEMLSAVFWFETHGDDWVEKVSADWLKPLKPFSQENPVWMEQKKQWLQRFFVFDHISQIKRKLSPPIIIVSDYGISRDEYHRPITCESLGKDVLDARQIRALLQMQ